MRSLKPRYNTTEYAQRGQTLYDREVRSHVTEQDEGKFVAIDIETGAFEIDTDDFTATERLLTRHPDAQIWLCRVDQEVTYRIGCYPQRANL